MQRLDRERARVKIKVGNATLPVVTVYGLLRRRQVQCAGLQGEPLDHVSSTIRLTIDKCGDIFAHT